MRFNERQMVIVSHEKADFEDRLNYKKVALTVGGNSQHKGFKERWFKLKYNLLFYFKFNEFGQIDLSQPSGLIVLENSFVQYEEESGTPFAFSITFYGDPRKHLFSARSEDTVQKWMAALKNASYEHLKKELKLLEEAIYRKKKNRQDLVDCSSVFDISKHVKQDCSVFNQAENLIEF